MSNIRSRSPRPSERPCAYQLASGLEGEAWRPASSKEFVRSCIQFATVGRRACLRGIETRSPEIPGTTRGRPVFVSRDFAPRRVFQESTDLDTGRTALTRTSAPIALKVRAERPIQTRIWTPQPRSVSSPLPSSPRRSTSCGVGSEWESGSASSDAVAGGRWTSDVTGSSCRVVCPAAPRPIGRRAAQRSTRTIVKRFCSASLRTFFAYRWTSSYISAEFVSHRTPARPFSSAKRS